MPKDPEKTRERQRRHRRKLKVQRFGEALADVDLRGRHGNHARGNEHYRWNDGRMISEHGYIKLRVGVDHPLADPNGYAYEHLIVWASAGRPLPADNETLHHANEDKTDNRLDNLEVMVRGDHNSLHLDDRERDPSTGRLLPKNRREWLEMP